MFELVIPAVNRHVFSRLFGDRREMISFGAQPPDDELFIRVLSPFFEPKRAMRIVPAAAGRATFPRPVNGKADSCYKPRPIYDR